MSQLSSKALMKDGSSSYSALAHLIEDTMDTIAWHNSKSMLRNSN